MFKSGQWNVICDVCGVKYKSSDLKKRWDGLMVCSKDFEQDHPQKYLRVTERSAAPAWVRSEPPDTFTHVCYVWARAPYADLAEADCAVVDNTIFSANYLYQLKTGQLLTTPVAPTYTFDGWFTSQYA